MQYFLWYTILLPLYLSLPSCTLIHSPRTGLTALTLWIAAQVLWLQQGFQLEFLGKSTFVPGLWFAGLGFFAVNCWILGIVVRDVGKVSALGSAAVEGDKEGKGSAEAVDVKKRVNLQAL
jgi:phosphatidylinositol glycan class M